MLLHMKTLLLSFLCCIALYDVRATDEPSIPSTLNGVLSKIHVGMTDQEVKKVLTWGYPNIKDAGGFGFLEGEFSRYNLDGRFDFGIYFTLKNSKYVVDIPMTFTVEDHVSKRRWDIKSLDNGHPAK